MARGAKDKNGKSGRRSSTLGRALGLMAFMPLASRAPLYARLMLALLVDERTPGSRKALLGGAVGYLLIGRDLIPDEIPILGGLDDLVIVVLAMRVEAISASSRSRFRLSSRLAMSCCQAR
jgi:uncharacterized membrane protein YkvA (DUF1232 family)